MAACKAFGTFHIIPHVTGVKHYGCARYRIHAKEVKAATKPVMNLAKATGDELGLAAQIAGNNMRVFGLQTSDLGRITDIIVTTVNKSSQTLTDYAQAAAKAGPNFRHANQDIMEMSA